MNNSLDSTVTHRENIVADFSATIFIKFILGIDIPVRTVIIYLYGQERRYQSVT